MSWEYGITAEAAAQAQAGLEWARDPLVTEDLTSLGESAPYVVRFREGTPPQPCECCGTLLTFAPEAFCFSAGDGPPPLRRWKPGAWETEAGRRHTPRRCGWMRERALSRQAGGAAPAVQGPSAGA